MLNDLGDKYEGQDDSEYHFSDEEVSYEVEPEPETPKPSGQGGGKENLISRLSSSGSRRMIISIVVFIVLVVIVYKMVAPTSTTPGTNITPEVAAAQQPATLPRNPAQAPQQQVAAAPAITPHAMGPQSVAAQPVPSQQPAPIMAQQQPGGVPQQTNATQPQTQAQAIQQQAMQAVANLPSVIPVSTPQTSYNVNQPVSSMTTPMTPVVNAGTANLSANTERAYNQFQAEYAQKLNDYAIQNKALQDQLNTLNMRVANMESQLHQLVQALTHQGQRGASSGAGMERERAERERPLPPVSHGIDNKIAYSVQAIIPGRAWLRSDTGETVTVAEGDAIKDLGRVTKIDPYDGIVEVNTGTKMLSLSYGNGG